MINNRGSIYIFKRAIDDHRHEDLKTLLQFTIAVIIAIFVCAAIFIAVVNVI